VNMKTKHSLALLIADFNSAITGAMLLAAQDEIRILDIEIALVVHVPGAYEIPLTADRLLDHKDITALVVLGFIEKGETQHGEVMGLSVSQSLLGSSIRHRKPVGIGIIGPGALVAQAEVRKEAYARAAVRAAVAAANVLCGL
jgi:6,7-dimethyl-8-ribityllumazine synthase